MILHACFQLLKDFVGQEKEMIEFLNWNHNEETAKAKLEIDFLYKWWLNRIHDDEDFENMNAQYEEDDQMLKRLLDVRKYLWT